MWLLVIGYSFSYTNWASGEPKRGDGDQCVFMDETRDYKWFALPCNTSKAFICQRGMGMTRLVTYHEQDHKTNIVQFRTK